MVNRYDFYADLSHGEITCQRLASSDGGHVEFTDYESLQRERDALREALSTIQSVFTGKVGFATDELDLASIDKLLAKGASQ